MRKITTALIGIIFLLSIPAGYKFIRESLEQFSRQLMAGIENKAILPGIKITDLAFDSARITGPDTLTWKGIRARIKVSAKTDSLSPGDLDLTITQIQLIALNLFDHDFLLMVDGIDATRPQDAGPDGAGRFTKGKLHVKFKMDLLSSKSVAQQIKELVEQASEIFRTGRTLVPMNCSGLISLTIGKDEAKALVRTTMDKDGYYILVINPEFFQTTAWLMKEELTDAEAQLLSRHPFRMKKLIEIMSTARQESQKYADVKTVPEDAYRHVLWSYLLTLEFGSEFAKAFTDAHEQGDLTNTEAEHEMDYRNNAVGREYAAKGYGRHEILDRLLNDPNVISAPR